MPSAGSAKLVWPGMVLAGFALGALVLVSWPEPTNRIVRLPYGEAAPKTPQSEDARAPRVTGVDAPAAAAAQASQPVGVAEPDPSTRAERGDTARVLAAVQPDRNVALGPVPIRSQLELVPDYAQESPEALGAEPLPGTVLTPAAPPVAR